MAAETTSHATLMDTATASAVDTMNALLILLMMLLVFWVVDIIIRLADQRWVKDKEEQDRWEIY